MYKYLTILVCFFVAFNLNAQQSIESKHYSIKHDSLYLFVDNSKKCWYTMELPTDTLIQIKGNMYFCNGKPIQVNAILFENGHDGGVMGSIKAEKYALFGRKKWELDYQQKTLGKHLKSGEELFFDNNGKPFLIWWYKSPKNTTIPTREIEIEAAGTSNYYSDTAAVELQVTHNIFLEFIVQSHTSVSISLPIYKNENIKNVKQKLRAIASSLKVYGSYIDLSILEQRIKNSGKYFLNDSLKFIEIEVPDWLNIIHTPFDNCFFGTFPEKENIYNAVGIGWTYKSDTMDFRKFISYDNKKRNRENITIISDDGNVLREFYTSNNSYFYCQDVYINSENLFCHVNFTATKSTYSYNVERFNELLKKIVVK